MSRLPGDPGPWPLFWYTLGGRLPRHRDWVRHDLTDAGWRARALLRLGLQLLPVLVVFALLPGPSFLHWLLPLFVLLVTGLSVLPYLTELRDRRLRQHGFTPPADRVDRLG